jgi:hypothetical protein
MEELNYDDIHSNTVAKRIKRFLTDDNFSDTIMNPENYTNPAPWMREHIQKHPEYYFGQSGTTSILPFVFTLGQTGLGVCGKCKCAICGEEFDMVNMDDEDDLPDVMGYNVTYKHDGHNIHTFRTTQKLNKSDNMYQQIFDKIASYLPDKWSRMAFFAGYAGNSYSMKFLVKEDDSDCVSCFSLQEISDINLSKLFITIDKMISSDRKENKWTSLSMIVDNSGEMMSELEYENHEEDLVTYEEKWEQRASGICSNKRVIIPIFPILKY